MTKKEVKKESNPKKGANKEPPKDEKKTRKNKDKEEEEEVYKWWEQKEAHPQGQHWKTLEHNGVMFPPDYKPHKLPVHYKMEDGKLKEIPMDPLEEEVATMFAVMRENTRPPSDYYVNPVFRKNFFSEWLEILNSNPERNLKRFGNKVHPIKSLDRVNFDAIWEWSVREKEKKKALTREEKQKIKKDKDEAEKEYKYCIWDGKKQPVGNFRIEPPGLFRGRGKHPLMGKLKARIVPEDIIINIGKGAKIPKPPPGHNWKEIRHDNTVTWLACWTEKVNNAYKYVMLAASSMVKGKSDYKKFEKARSLGERVAEIRHKYTSDWDSSDIGVRQRAVALYFIDFLALRCGHEKGEDEAETFGACSLKCEHINLEKKNFIKFDFLGKDSIRYCNEVQVNPRVYQLCREFVKGKTPNSDLFDRLRPEKLNDHLRELMPGLTAKVFRTYNASQTLDNELHNSVVDNKLGLPEKIVYFNAANTKVALLCNHQKSQSKGHQKQMVGLQDKLNLLKHTLERLNTVKSVLKSKKGNLDQARKVWDEEEHKQQLEWLEKYGTEEDKETYKTTGGKPSKPKSNSTSKNTQNEDSSDDDDVPITKKRRTTSAKKATNDPKLKSHVEKLMESDDEEVSKKRKKPDSKKKNDSDSDVPIKKRKTKK